MRSLRLFLGIFVPLLVLPLLTVICGGSSGHTLALKDRKALVALYNATDGPNWIRDSNWLSDLPIGEWDGVDTDRMGRVIDLRLDRNGLNGEIPPELGQLAVLQVLLLHGNQLSGEIPPELGNLSHLEALTLDENQLSGEIPPELVNLTLLRYLHLHNNRLSGEIPPELGDLVLESLKLSGNRFSGCVSRKLSLSWGVALPVCLPPDQLRDREALVALYNATGGPSWHNNDNWLSDLPIGEWYGVAVNVKGRVTHLGLYLNYLNGEIPRELGNLTHLEYLNLGDNYLSGEIPRELGNIATLEGLFLFQNNLSGEIPPELGNLDNLVDLSISTNGLSGEIPPELGNLTSLEELKLQRNQLSGEIPPELRHLHKLGRLDLGWNQLSGEIPAELGKLPKLWYLRLDSNEMKGCIPGGLYGLQVSYQLDLPFCD